MGKCTRWQNIYSYKHHATFNTIKLGVTAEVVHFFLTNLGHKHYIHTGGWILLTNFQIQNKYKSEYYKWNVNVSMFMWMVAICPLNSRFLGKFSSVTTGDSLSTQQWISGEAPYGWSVMSSIPYSCPVTSSIVGPTGDRPWSGPLSTTLPNGGSKGVHKDQFGGVILDNPAQTHTGDPRGG